MNPWIAKALDTAFGHPRGLLGQLGGAVMARGNAATERQLVRLARLSGSEAVLVVGPGPGVGLRQAGEQAGRVVGVDPSAEMRRVAERRCAALVAEGKVEIRVGTAEETGARDAEFDVVLSVNNAILWSDRPRALAELHRALRPGGLLLISVHERWLPGGRSGLTADARSAGFDGVQTWAWDPPGRSASTAAQLRAHRPED
jgi:SAM-dependent methyltransferase